MAQELCKDSHYTHVKFNEKSITELCSEIKIFTSTYVTLREVEKKIIRDWPHPIKCHDIKNSLRKIFIDSIPSNCQTTERYSGGKKEKALENLALGSATDEDRKIINGEACAWCGNELIQCSISRDVESTYCSQECAEEGRLRRGGRLCLL